MEISENKMLLTFASADEICKYCAAQNLKLLDFNIEAAGPVVTTKRENYGHWFTTKNGFCIDLVQPYKYTENTADKITEKGKLLNGMLKTHHVLTTDNIDLGDISLRQILLSYDGQVLYLSVIYDGVVFESATGLRENNQAFAQNLNNLEAQIKLYKTLKA